MMQVSKFGRKIAAASGIGRLMEDLGVALSQGRDMLMLGGGNPAQIPQVRRCFRDAVEKLLADGAEFEQAIGNYSPPGGSKEFIEAVAGLLRRELGWDVQPENIALTNGSQTAFFILFNIFAGPCENGATRKILFPLAPEYIGYCDVGLAEDLLVANKPQIEHVDDRLFKYHIDFGRLEVSDEIGAICVSRPTNPTGNVLTDAEIRRLSELAHEHEVPLIVDNAYGMPFPNIVFVEARPIWDRNTIFCMSLSKLGLPAVRTGIVVAAEEVVEMISRANAVMSLAPGSLGAAIVTDLVRTGEVTNISRNVIRPFYQKKVRTALGCVYQELEGVDFHVHKPEGAFFLWLWFPGLPITNEQLYQRLKKRGVLVVPGHYFFPGLKEDWPHKNECTRVNYSQDEKTFAAGIKIVAEEVKRAWSGDRDS
ncbi:MAG: valine--pyruvate transaminase [Phycisphaerales bacterium]|nr:MAG: valine--pyruvate transaminase [Phycisphaerales bacterium]